MKIYVAADHAGFTLKEMLKKLLVEKGYVVEDCGANSFIPTDDYSTYVPILAQKISENPEDKGIICAGSGQAEAMLANKFRKVRAAEFYGPKLPTEPVDAAGRESADPYEIVKLSRLHNNANVLSIGSRFVIEEEMREAVLVFLQTPFSGEARHARRIAKMTQVEEEWCQ